MPRVAEASSSRDPAVLAALRDRFGHQEFRHGQPEIIDSVLSGAPTLAILPTGAGKSLTYQLPAVVLEGTTLVISPLIALIRDQVEAMRALGIAASSLTSANSEADRYETMRALTRGELDLLYVAPERFRSPSFIDAIRDVNISLLAIDEAHCISSWGHDFRPDYARLGEVLRNLAPPHVMALTATATPEVREDIVASLGLQGANTIVTGFDRPNLKLSVEAIAGTRKKSEAVERIVRHWAGKSGCAIVYAATRKRCEAVAESLEQAGLLAAAYHAGLPKDERTRVQQAFADDKLEVVVATTAFGMGVDKSDVRVVVHYDIPSSVEAYYQEVGRGGRDGEPAGGVLLYDQGDLRWSYMRLESSCPTASAVDRAFEAVRFDPNGSFDQVVERIEEHVGPAARAALIALERGGAVRLGNDRVSILVDSPTIDRAALDRRERVERSKLDAMIGYVQRAACRRVYLLDYFGDPDRPDACGECDRCELPTARSLEDDALMDVLKAMSAVARMRGRFGKARVADVLIGSRAKAVTTSRLDQLSTHGLLAKWPRSEIMSLLDSLARAGLVEQTRGEYPKLQLTPRGAVVLKGRGPVELDLRLRRWGDDDGEGRTVSSTRSGRVRSKTEAAEVTDADQPLYDRLREWRRGVASSIAKPPYMIAHDKTLAALCAAKPADLDALAEVPGIGPSKIETYGDAILAIVRGSAERG